MLSVAVLQFGMEVWAQVVDINQCEDIMDTFHGTRIHALPCYAWLMKGQTLQFTVFPRTIHQNILKSNPFHQRTVTQLERYLPMSTYLSRHSKMTPGGMFSWHIRPIKGTSGGLEALHWCVRLARANNNPVTICHVNNGSIRYDVSDFRDFCDVRCLALPQELTNQTTGCPLNPSTSEKEIDWG